MAAANNVFTLIADAPSLLNPTFIQHTQSGLTAGERYKFNVAAYNQVGEGAWAQHIDVIAADLPKPPANPPIVTLITETSISLTLEPIIGPSNSGSEVTGYIV